MDKVIGIHAVLEALRSGRGIEHVMVARGAQNARLQQIIDECRRLGVPLRFEMRESLDRAAASASHQGVVALAAAHKYSALEKVIASPGKAGLLLLLDGVEDPHNLGAIIRSAYAAGADAIVIPERRAVGLTETVTKTAAGALEHIPVARVANLNRALELLKESQYWIYGLDERAEQSYDQQDYRGRIAFVLGGEGRGLHQQAAKHCDFLVRIPVAGSIASLNVSVAAGVVLFEAFRQRRLATGPKKESRE